MDTFFARTLQWSARCGAAALLVLASICGAQGQNPAGPQGQMGGGIPSQSMVGAGGTMTDQLQYGTLGHELQREQDAAYKAFVKEPEPVRKIQLGDTFLKKYPKSPFEEQIDVGMMNAYRERKDWKDAYRFGDSALVLEPDDVDVLTICSWTIAHVSDPKDPDHEEQLTKAETYAKHALDVLSKLKKPKDLTDEQFASAKSMRQFQTHSALGLVYFRRNDYDNSAKELAQATKNNPTPDPTDLFILGVDFQNLSRYAEAAESFGRCSQIAGPLQDRCKQGADSATNVASQSKAN